MIHQVPTHVISVHYTVNSPFASPLFLHQSPYHLATVCAVAFQMSAFHRMWRQRKECTYASRTAGLQFLVVVKIDFLKCLTKIVSLGDILLGLLHGFALTALYALHFGGILSLRPEKQPIGKEKGVRTRGVSYLNVPARFLSSWNRCLSKSNETLSSLAVAIRRLWGLPTLKKIFSRSLFQVHAGIHFSARKKNIGFFKCQCSLVDS